MSNYKLKQYIKQDVTPSSGFASDKTIGLVVVSFVCLDRVKIVKAKIWSSAMVLRHWNEQLRVGNRFKGHIRREHQILGNFSSIFVQEIEKGISLYFTQRFLLQ